MKRLFLAALMLQGMAHADQLSAFGQANVTAAVVKVAMHYTKRPTWEKEAFIIWATYAENAIYNCMIQKTDETQFAKNNIISLLVGSGMAFSFKF